MDTAPTFTQPAPEANGAPQPAQPVFAQPQPATAQSVPAQPAVDPVTPVAAPLVGAPPPPGQPPAQAKPKSLLPTKTLLVGAVAALVILFVLGIGFYLLKGMVGRPSNGPVSLTYWGLWESPQVMQPLIDEYHKLHPNVTIHYEQRPIQNHYATVKARISKSGSQSDVIPDIVRLHSSWVPVLRNYLSPIPSSVMTASAYQSTFYPVTRDQFLSGGQYYALPLEVDGLTLVYNQQLFNQAGITQPPATWDDVRQDAAKITQRDDKGRLLVGGIAMGSARNVDNFADIIGLLMAQNGVSFTDSKGNITFNTSMSGDGRNLGAEALSFYTLFTTTEKSWDDTMETSTLAFSKGKVGMILVPSWRVMSLVNQNPQLQMKVVPVPHLTTDQKTGYASYWVESVPKASPHQADAWAFVKFLSDKENEVQLFSLEQQVRSFGEPFSRMDLATNLSSDPLVGAFVSQGMDYQASIFAGDTGATDLNDAINADLANAVQATLAGGSTGRDAAAAQALNALAKQVTDILASQR